MKKPFVPDRLPLEKLDLSSMVRLIGEANNAVSRYGGLLEALPNQALLLSPLRTKEAVLSSKIEGTQVTLQQVFRFEEDEFTDSMRLSDFTEVLNYREALALGQDAIQTQSISLGLMRGMHKVLMSNVRGDESEPGAFRTTQNFIGSPGSTLENARYVPPAPLVMNDFLENLEQYIRDPVHDALSQAAIIHAQFEIIHPFRDGNGRIGRLLVPLYLASRNVFSYPSYFISEVLEEDRTGYYDRLLAISEECDWLGWIQYFLEKSAEQSCRNLARARRLHDLYHEMKEKFQVATRSTSAIRSLDILFASPIVSMNRFAETTRLSRQTALNLLNALQRAGLIELVFTGRGRTSSIYRFPAVLEALEI